MSTVYMPGHKITMLPDDVVRGLHAAGRARLPGRLALRHASTKRRWQLKGTETRLERVPIVANLRHDQLDGVVTQAGVDAPGRRRRRPSRRASCALSFLFRLAKQLKAQREVVRGKPENFNRPDYNFRLVGDDGGEPTGNEQVQISTRQRGAPLDLIVSEAMILANSSWGGWLGELGVPGLYRSQASLAPGIKVRMGTQAAAARRPRRQELRLEHLAAAPLHRPREPVADHRGARHGKTAALAAPFKPKDADLFSILSGFDAAYAAYNGYQGGMERFWTLKYLQQQGITELDATLSRTGTAPGARRHAAAGVPRHRHAGPARAAPACACSSARSTRSRSTCTAPSSSA